MGRIVVGLLVLIGVFSAAVYFTDTLSLRIPPAILGICCIFLLFLYFRCVPAPIDKVGRPLIKHMSLFFVPAIVAIVEYVDVIVANAYAIFGAVILSTILSLAITAWLSQRLLYALNPSGKTLTDSSTKDFSPKNSSSKNNASKNNAAKNNPTTHGSSKQ